MNITDMTEVLSAGIPVCVVHTTVLTPELRASSTTFMEPSHFDLLI
jgi:hypothetical protein